MIESRAVEIRFEADPERLGPGRLVGVLLPYEVRASDRAEQFSKGALRWPSDGVLLRAMHRRDSPIARFTPEATDGEVRVAIQLPDTTSGRDAASNVKAGVLRGLSVEFVAERERQASGVRVIEYWRAWWVLGLWIRQAMPGLVSRYGTREGGPGYGCESD